MRDVPIRRTRRAPRSPAEGVRARLLAVVLLACAATAATAAEQAPTLDLATSGAVITGAPLRLTVTLDTADAATLEVRTAVDGREVDRRELATGEHLVELDHGLARGGHRVTAEAGAATAQLDVRVISGWLSILPPLLAIGLSLIFKDVLVSLFLGVFSGALFINGFNPLTAFARSIDHYVAPSLASFDNARIILFSALLGGMVGVIGRSGGTRGIVDRLSRFATSPARGQLATWALGVVIFFDDYANSLIVGSTMRPITDRLRISREKLAYIVDSTAAPVASLVPISTWIGFEIGLIAAAFTALGIDGDYNAYAVFMSSIAYRFYPIFALVLGFTIAASRRDFGPMWRAEVRAAQSGQLIAAGDTPLANLASEYLEPPPEAPKRAINALLPILTVVVVTLVGLYQTGSATVERGAADGLLTYLREVFSASDSFSALLWASLSGVTVALALALAQRILDVKQAMGALVEGVRTMLLAFMVLLLAWSIGSVCQDLHTADFVVGLTREVLSPHWLPALVFLASAGIAFATGASWGTMAILMPVVIPISHGLSEAAGYAVGSEQHLTLMVGTVSSVLAGSVWGDHCSPISDTTILSSMASGCDHIAHVRTQIPYAVGIGLLGMLLGDIPTAYGLSPWIALLAGSAIIVGGVLWLGKKSG